MKLESTGIIIGLRPFSERDMIAHIFTHGYGVLAGMIKGAQIAKKNRTLVGQVGLASWNARLDSNLGVFHFESSRNLAAPLMSAPAALSYMNSAFALLQTLLPEREKYESLYDNTEQFLWELGNMFLKFGNRAICPPTEKSQSDFPTPPKGGVVDLCRCARSLPPWGESETQSVFGGGQIYNPKRRSTELALTQAQNLRKSMTSAEKLLWHYLKNNKQGYAFRKQCPISKYIADFVCLEKKLIIELDGEQHYEENNRIHDTTRTYLLNGEGYKIIRFNNDQIFKNIDGVLGIINDNLCPPTTHPRKSSIFAGPGASPSATPWLCDSPQGGSNRPLSLCAITPPLGGVGELCRSKAEANEPVGGQIDSSFDDEIRRLYINWEIWLLRELGYALDLTKCSNCGCADNLTHISRRTGRAVCQTCAAPWLDRCFPLPVDLNATKYFLCKIAAEHGTQIPLARNLISNEQ